MLCFNNEKDLTQICNYISESLPDLPCDVLLLLYRIVACSESGLE